MTHEIVIQLDPRPGTLAEALGALAKEGVNIRGGFGVNVGAHDAFHMVVDEEAKAARALRAAGRAFTTREVVTAETSDRPGTLLALCEKLAAAQVNIEAIYTLTPTRPGTAVVVFRVADAAAAARALREA